MPRQNISLDSGKKRSIARIAFMYFMTVIFSCEAQAGDVPWHTDLRDAVAESGELRKPMLIMFTADWCGYCQKMRRQTLENDVVARRVKEGFVPVIVDVDEAPELAKRLRIAGLPTVLIVSPDRKVTHRIAGYQSAREFDAQLVAALALANRPAGQPRALPPKPLLRQTQGRLIRAPLPQSEEKMERQPLHG